MAYQSWYPYLLLHYNTKGGTVIPFITYRFWVFGDYLHTGIHWEWVLVHPHKEQLVRFCIGLHAEYSTLITV